VLRHTLGLKVTEISDFNKAEPHVEAEPVFRDDIVTVYSIPIAPMPHHRGEEPADSEASPNMSENVLKRKRESSPELPMKRSFLDPTVPVPDGPSTPSTSTPLLDRFLADPDFDPVTLEGDEADAWRQLIIERMFTRTEPPLKPRLPPKHTNKKGKVEKNAGDTGTETPEACPSQASLTSVPQVPHWVEGATKSQEKPPGRSLKEANPAASLKPLPSFTPPVRDVSTAYIVVGPRVRGKFDAKRAKELRLFGPLRGRVARGETVTLTVDDGTGVKVQRTVRPEDCLGEPETRKVRPPILAPRYCTKRFYKVVIILDVPTPDHIESLVSAFSTPAYSPFRVKTPAHRKDYVIHVIYHLLGSNVLEDERYKSFMNGFADDTQHLISSPDHNPDPLTFTRAGLNQLRLNQLDSEMFPLPYFRTTPRKDLSCALLLSHLFGCLTVSRSLLLVVTQLPPQSSFMQPNSYVDVRPPRRVLVDPILEERDKFHPTVAAEVLPELPLATNDKFAETKSIISNRLATLDNDVPNAGDEVVVIPLGTNSAISSRYRNGD
jgi:ribonuclease Z